MSYDKRVYGLTLRSANKASGSNAEAYFLIDFESIFKFSREELKNLHSINLRLMSTYVKTAATDLDDRTLEFIISGVPLINCYDSNGKNNESSISHMTLSSNSSSILTNGVNTSYISFNYVPQATVRILFQRLLDRAKVTTEPTEWSMIFDMFPVWKDMPNY